MEINKINKDAISLLKLIESNNYQAFIVGGAIRDLALNITPVDYDICTNMPITLLEDLFKSMIVETKGKSFLSIKVKYKNKIYEITNTRTENEYKKPGYPSSTQLTNSIHDDLKRRDFTINALAYSPSLGLIDDYNSLNDIENRILRTIGNPFRRFSEDPSRILRGIRFASSINLMIEENTLNAMILIAPEIKKLSYNKVMKEFIRILELEDISIAIDLLDKINFFEIMWGLKTELKEKIYKENLNNLKLSTHNVDSRLAILFRLSSTNI